MQRIVIVGVTGSGKSTLAARLGEMFDIPVFELDLLFWQPGWVQTPREAFRAKVDTVTQGAGWIVAGNYSAVRDIIWSRADTIVWLDYPFPLVASRLLRRTMRRIVTREVILNGNVETIRGTFLSRESILLWLLKTYRKKRRDIPLVLAQPEYQHLALVHLHKPHETARWLNKVAHERMV